MNALLSFSIENYRSIFHRKTISFIPSAIKDNPIDNIYMEDNVRYLRTASIYGANSSGKSNVVRSIAMMARLILSSVSMNDGDELQYEPFLLSRKSLNMPTRYEMDFLVGGMRYYYLFSNTSDRIHDEALVRIEKNGTQTKLFLRSEDGIGVNEKAFPEGTGLEERTNDNRLFLSLVGQLGGGISNTIIKFFRENLRVLSGLDTYDYKMFSKRMLNANLPGYIEMKNFFSHVKLGFLDISAVQRDFSLSDLPEDMPNDMKKELAKELNGKKQIKVYTSHGIYDDNGNRLETVSFDFDNMESAGTKKLFDMAGPFFDALTSGDILVVDELDAKMHPLISQEIISLFNDPKRNKYGAQLIFTTHDTNLLSSKQLRRDQIWFTEKDETECTDLYNMMDIVLPDGTKPRGDGNLERNYIRGRYGAIPYISYND